MLLSVKFVQMQCLKKVLNVRRKKAGEFLKDVRAINAIKLEDSHLLEGVRYHTAGSEP